MPRPATAVINLSALRHNLSVARSRASGARVWAVVKANAYGHGLLRAARAFTDADGLALVEPEGAALLRSSGWKKPILLIEGCFDGDDVRLVVEHDVETVVHSEEQIRMLRQGALVRPVRVWVKLNTGMNRLGFPPETFRKALSSLENIPAVRVIGYLSHFANADVVDNAALSVADQTRRYEAAIAGLHGLRSLANSAGELLHGGLAADWVRPGIMLYGGSPGSGSAAAFGLAPGMTFQSEVIGMQHIAAGESVGYGSTFVSDRPMRVAIVAGGYADGYPRHAPTGTPILLDGRRSRLIGRVSMDMVAADATALPEVGVGSAAVFWGEGLPIDEVAAAAGTIGYELMCAIAPRVRVEERENGSIDVASR